MIFKKRIFFSISFTIISLILYYSIFKNIYNSNNIIFYYAIHPFNICTEQPLIWNIIKLLSIIFYLFSNFIIFYFISKKIFKKIIKKEKRNNINNLNEKNYFPINLNLNIGFNNENNLISISEKSLYQNILITGTIGTGKTSSAMYPFTKQLIEYKSNFPEDKLGMLILDVKGNYHLQVKQYCKNTRKRK